jgi:uncharacterized protein YodC (DUF2158 family)
MYTILVHGPRACGKTLNRDVIADYFGCDAIVDAGLPARAGMRALLSLTCRPPVDSDDYDVVHEFAEVRKYILNHPAFANRWIDPLPERVKQAPCPETDLPHPFGLPWPYAAPGLDRLSFLYESPACQHYSKASTEETAPLDEAADKPRFNRGDVVRLKSCVKPMTVIDVGCRDTYEVMWFDGPDLKGETFHGDCLTHGDPDLQLEVPF